MVQKWKLVNRHTVVNSSGTVWSAPVDALLNCVHINRINHQSRQSSRHVNHQSRQSFTSRQATPRHAMLLYYIFHPRLLMEKLVEWYTARFIIKVDQSAVTVRTSLPPSSRHISDYRQFGVIWWLMCFDIIRRLDDNHLNGRLPDSLSQLSNLMKMYSTPSITHPSHVTLFRCNVSMITVVSVGFHQRINHVIHISVISPETNFMDQFRSPFGNSVTWHHCVITANIHPTEDQPNVIQPFQWHLIKPLYRNFEWWHWKLEITWEPVCKPPPVSFIEQSKRDYFIFRIVDRNKLCGTIPASMNQLNSLRKMYENDFMTRVISIRLITSHQSHQSHHIHLIGRWAIITSSVLFLICSMIWSNWSTCV